MITVVTHETSGFDKCSQELSRRLPESIRRIHTKRYFERDEEEEFLKILHATTEPVHLTNQNFARYHDYLWNPYIVTVHDLIRNFYNFDGDTVAESHLLEKDIEGIRRAAHVISVSEFTKDELVTRLEIPSENISVIHNGLDHEIFTPHGQGFGPSYPYILYVGSERPRKNLDILLSALADLTKIHTHLRLIKVGAHGRHPEHHERVQEIVKEHHLEDNVVPFGFVLEESLPILYRGALCLVTPSLMEGFSLPPLEAMACGCPVIVSDIAAHREVVADAGIYFEPKDDEELAKAIQGLIFGDPRQRLDLRDAGLRRAEEFSWDRNAEETLEIYKRFGE